VSIVTGAIVPICIHIVRSAARVEECSGASCSPALRLAGLFAPRPTPMRNAEADSHINGVRPPGGLIASSSIPAAIIAPAANSGALYLVRLSAKAEATENMIAARPWAASNVPELYAFIPAPIEKMLPNRPTARSRA
jgi:hypothetical protein